MISKKERLLSIINQIKAHEADIPGEVTAKINKAEETLQRLSSDEVELMTNNVVTSPPAERDFDAANPEYLLQSSYREIERMARQKGAHPEIAEALTAMQHYFNIEEKDGYFP